MENICSLELCNSLSYYFFLRHPDLTLHPELALSFLPTLPMLSPLYREEVLDRLILG